MIPKMKVQARNHRPLPHPGEWPNFPTMVCANNVAQHDLVVPDYGTGPCPIGKPFKFSSALFEGTILIRLRDVQSDDDNHDEYFAGRKRRFQTVVQGRFKEQIKVRHVLVGHEFVRPLKRLPPSWIVKIAAALVKRLAPGTDIALYNEQPHAFAILAATSQVLRADWPGDEPDIRSSQIKEDTALFGGIFKNGKVSSFRRKAHMAYSKRAQDYAFDPKLVYTFEDYNDMLDAASYSIDLRVVKVNLDKSLDGQPIQVLCKTTDGRYLWNFQGWHEKLQQLI